MSFKKLGVALLAVFALGAIMASSAFAENEFSATGGQWYTETEPGVFKKLEVGVTDDLTVTGGAASLVSEIGTKPIKFTSTGVTGTECSAVNNTTTSATIDCKALVFTGVSVSGGAAAGCSTPTTITSKELTGVLGMNKAGTLATLKITPKAGEAAAFATVELTGTCAIAGLYKLTGTIFAQAINATGIFATTQGLSFSEAIQESAGTATSLKFGENSAILTGTVKDALEGSPEWCGKEKNNQAAI